MLNGYGLMVNSSAGAERGDILPRLAKLKNSPSLRTRDGYVLKSIRIRLECGQFEWRMDENSFFGITVLRGLALDQAPISFWIRRIKYDNDMKTRLTLSKRTCTVL